MKLTFPNAELVKLVADATEKWPTGHQPLHGVDNGAGFWIVGDHGVYLMHNGTRPEGEESVVVYARECDPTKMEFDDWWDAKRASFGGDDGVDFIPPTFIINAACNGSDIEIDFADDAMSMFEVKVH